MKPHKLRARDVHDLRGLRADLLMWTTPYSAEYRARCMAIYDDASLLICVYGYAGAARRTGLHAATIRRALRSPFGTQNPTVAKLRKAATLLRELEHRIRISESKARTAMQVQVRAQAQVQMQALEPPNVFDLAKYRQRRDSRRRVVMPYLPFGPDAA